MIVWAHLYGGGTADPKTDRIVVERGGIQSMFVPVPGPDAIPSVVQALVAEGVMHIELSGFFGPAGAQAALDAIDFKVPVGAVTFDDVSALKVAEVWNHP